MLPVKKGSIVVVDASEESVKSGKTCPSELLKLYRKGITLYTYPQLHAKVFVFGTRLFLGSSNVSNHSANHLAEAVITTSDRNSVRQAKEFIKSLCISELGKKSLDRLAKIYRPPIFQSANKSTVKKKRISKLPSFWVTKFEYVGEYDKESTQQIMAGYKEAQRVRMHKSRHFIDVIEWNGKLNPEKGDSVLCVSDDGSRSIVWPPGTVINFKRWKKGKKAWVYLEVPSKREKSLKSVVKKVGIGMINKEGKKSKTLAARISALWN